MIHHTSCQDTGRIQNTDHQQPELLVMATEHCGLGTPQQPQQQHLECQCQELFPSALWVTPLAVLPAKE